MTEQDDADVVSCADCGEVVSVSEEVLYPFGYDGVLCLSCARRRGGAYDSAEDRWLAVPRVEDLLMRLESHYAD
jgi:hypothetical protein